MKIALQMAIRNGTERNEMCCRQARPKEAALLLAMWANERILYTISVFMALKSGNKSYTKTISVCILVLRLVQYLISNAANSRHAATHILIPIYICHLHIVRYMSLKEY